MPFLFLSGCKKMAEGLQVRKRHIVHNTFPFEKAVVRFVTSLQVLGAVAVNTLPKTGKMVYNIDTYMDFHVVSDEN